MKKAPTLTERKNKLTTQKRHQNIDYTTIADRLKSVTGSKRDTHTSTGRHTEGQHQSYLRNKMNSVGLLSSNLPSVIDRSKRLGGKFDRSITRGKLLDNNTTLFIFHFYSNDDPRDPE